MTKPTKNKEEQDIWKQLRMGGYSRGVGENVVDPSRLLLGTLNPDGSVKIELYGDQRALRQLEFEGYLTKQGIKCIRVGSDEAISAIRDIYRQLENILNII